MSQFFLSIWFVISMLFGASAPASAVIVPNDGNDVSSITSISDFEAPLSDYEIEDGTNVGIFDVSCSEQGSSVIDGVSLTTSGGGYASNISVADCADLYSVGGATYQIIETTFPMSVTCNADCEVYTLYDTFESGDLTQEVGKIWVRVIGPDPQLIVIGE